MKNRLLPLLVLCCWLLPGLAAGEEAAAPDDALAARLREKAFCSPSETFAQPASWQKQPIRYDRRNTGANLALTLDQQIYQLLLQPIRLHAVAKGLDIRVQEGTCGISAGLVSRKAVDVAGYCCPPARSDRLPGLTFHTLGIASIAILTHPGHPIGALSQEEVRKLFRGEVPEWSRLRDQISGLPGPPWPVRAVGRLHCRLRPGHWRALLWDPDEFGPRMEEVGTIPDMIHRVVSQPGSIGYETLWHVERYRERGRPRTIAIDGVAPEDTAALLAGRYPYYHVFNLTLWQGEGLENPRAAELVAHLTRVVESMDPRFSMIPASALRRAGWQFQGDELIGEPKKQ